VEFRVKKSSIDQVKKNESRTERKREERVLESQIMLILLLVTCYRFCQ
jgi:hypothetical protein